MRLIKDLNKTLACWFLPCLIMGCLPTKPEGEKNKETFENDVIVKADAYLEKEDYNKTHQILVTFIDKYQQSKYLDDAYYRLAYLHVFADDKNSFFNYQIAFQKFLDFKQKFPQSHYLSACNNWLKILNLYFGSNSGRDPKIVVSNNKNCREVEVKNQELVEENKRLKELLKDLESALDR